jgi:urease accessory protein
MKNVTPTQIVALLLAASALPTLGHAHPGNALVYDCASGIAHPFHGWDHIAAMVAVGVFSAQLGGRARWLLPATFITVMTCAAILGTRGFTLPGIETMIATSVLVFGLLIATTARLPLAANASIVALFALAHGIAHGAEIPAQTDAVSYTAGFLISTAALHGLGLFFGYHAGLRSAHFPRAAGVGCATVGAVLLTS